MERLRQIADVLKTTPGSLLDGPPKAVVPAEIIYIWERIPSKRRDEAKKLLEVIAGGAAE